jgi:hypothetical protein
VFPLSSLSSVTSPPQLLESGRIAVPALPITIGLVAMLAFAVHAPLLMMELPAQSTDATTHMFFAQHYAQDWFNPWNEKWFGGFSQTSFPPLAHQWTAMFAKFMSVKLAYMLVQMISILLLIGGVFRYGRIWCGERSAGYAALASLFLGSLALLVYQSGQLPTVLATALLLHALASMYAWAQRAVFTDLLLAAALATLSATADHITLLFGGLLFGAPLLALAAFSREEGSSAAGSLSRVLIGTALAAGGIAVALLPFWSFLLNNPNNLLIAPHGDRENVLLSLTSTTHYVLLPLGALLLALPFVFLHGLRTARLVPLFFAFYAALLLGLGGATPVARMVLGGFYESVSLDRFIFWSTLLMLPIAGVLLARLVDRFALRGIVALTLAAILSFGAVFAWMSFHPLNAADFKTEPIVNFLARDNHDRYRYLTLGFGSKFADITMRANAKTVDGAFPLGRLLPEMQPFGWSRLDQARTYGATGMESLRAVLKHANNYGLKYVFVRDRYYEPLLAFAGWRQVESYDNGNVTLWSKEDVPAARPMVEKSVLPAWQRYLWGIIPLALSVFALLLAFFVRPLRDVAHAIADPEGDRIIDEEAS